ncbi:MAG: DNA primase catalytic subunit PriS [Candidatus Altiarchaeales archaeon HGW-Altiarchaeales-1]|nr:MAG: DNA primase catalytic subunit PriS [Candidatus Altiarchaeales archaeon HGW-Altiarchaeales-1]
MEQKTAQYVKRKFQEYYIKHNLPAPPEVNHREFGFWLDSERKSVPIRHKSFKSESELNRYLQSQQSLFHISYSTAYYEFPENEIARKGWLGADLIFDFDVKMEFIELKTIGVIWDEILKLLDFLKGDFGFSANVLKVNFSGSKGFHLKVFDERVRKLGKEERREILDYVTANGLLDDIKKSEFFEVKEIGSGVEIMDRKRGGTETKTEILIGPKIDDVGWGKRIAESAIEILKEDENNKRLGEEKRKKTKEILEDIKNGNYDKFREYLKDKRMKEKIKKRSVNLTADTDRQVTQDISRLIRLENTLHGGTGLIAKVVALDNFNVEKNFKDFVAFNETNVEISLNDDQKFWLLNDFELKKGINKVPEYAAIYLMLKGKAEILK